MSRRSGGFIAWRCISVVPGKLACGVPHFSSQGQIRRPCGLRLLCSAPNLLAEEAACAKPPSPTASFASQHVHVSVEHLHEQTPARPPVGQSEADEAKPRPGTEPSTPHAPPIGGTPVKDHRLYPLKEALRQARADPRKLRAAVALGNEFLACESLSVLDAVDLIMIYKTAMDSSQCMAVLEVLQRRGIIASYYHYNPVMSSCGQAGKWTKVLSRSPPPSPLALPRLAFRLVTHSRGGLARCWSCSTR